MHTVNSAQFTREPFAIGKSIHVSYVVFNTQIMIKRGSTVVIHMSLALSTDSQANIIAILWWARFAFKGGYQKCLIVLAVKLEIAVTVTILMHVICIIS